MFSTKTGAVVLAAASAISTSQDLEALSIKGDFSLGLRLIPDLERTHPSVWRSCVVTIRGVPCISLGNGAFVTAGHVGCPRGATGHYRVRAKDGTPCDLVLFRHAEGPHGVEPLAIAPQLERAKGEVVVLATSKAQGLAFATSVAHVNGPGVKGEEFNPLLLLFTPDYGLPGAGKVQVGDSGGGVFQFDGKNGRWLLAGILVSIIVNKEPGLEFRQMTGSFSCAVDTSVSTGVGQQLIDYREGRIQGGDLADQLGANGGRLRGVGAGCVFIGIAAATGMLWARYQSRQRSKMIGSSQPAEDNK